MFEREKAKQQETQETQETRVKLRNDENSPFIIRPLTRFDDLEAYKQLYLLCDNVLVKGLAENDERLARIGRNHVNRVCQTELLSFETVERTFFQGKSQFWVLLDTIQNVIIGSIALLEKTPSSSDQQVEREGELQRMCVSPNYRRKGLGDYLVRHLISYAASNDFKRVSLTTPSSNTSAIQMYTKAGFVLNDSFVVAFGDEDGELEISKLSIELSRDDQNRISNY